MALLSRDNGASGGVVTAEGAWPKLSLGDRGREGRGHRAGGVAKARGSYGASMGLCGAGMGVWDLYRSSMGLGWGYEVAMGSLWGWDGGIRSLWGPYGAGMWVWGLYGALYGAGGVVTKPRGRGFSVSHALTPPTAACVTRDVSRPRPLPARSARSRPRWGDHEGRGRGLGGSDL